MNKNLKKVFASVFASVMLLSACGGGAGATTDKNFITATTNKDTAIEGGILKHGIVTDTALPGIYNTQLYMAQPDNVVLSYVTPSLFRYTEDFEIDEKNPGLASIEFAEDLLSLTVKIDEKLNWTDGTPVSAEDYAFSFAVVGHKDYEGIRYSANFPNIVGMEAYHDGKADTISGIEIVDAKTVKVSFVEPSLSIKANFWGYPMAKHVFKDIPVKDMLKSEHVRTNILGYGPFKVEKVVTGESVKMVANEEYLLGKPKLAGVEIKAIQPTSIDEAIKNGEVDFIDSYPVSNYDPETAPSNMEVLGKLAPVYTYIGFKLGNWDEAKGENIPNPDAKMADKNLRQAMMFAMNNKQVGDELYKGLREPATSIIPPVFKKYNNTKLEAFEYDPEKANKILDDAGYKDVDGDGFRETPEGKELVINYATMSGSAVAEPQSQFYMQNWKEVGLNVQLLDGRLHEFNSFYDRVEKDDKNIDIYEAAWSTGYDQNPKGLWGKDSFANYGRYQTEEGNALIDAISSEKAIFDETYRKEQYDAWQEYFREEVPAGPTLYRYELYPTNKRVKGFDIAPGTIGANAVDWHLIEVTEEEPVKAE